MPYTLTSASALGLDLTRRPGGAAVARLLVRGLAVEPGAAVPVVGAAPADVAAVRSRARALVDAGGPGEGLDDEAPAVGPSVPCVAERHRASGADPFDALTTALQRLRRRTDALRLGTVDDLLRFAADLPVDAGGRPGGAVAPGLVLRPPAETALGRALADAVLAALVAVREEQTAPVLAQALSHALDRAPAGGHVLPPAGAPGDALPPGPLQDLVQLVARTDPGRLARLGRTEPPTGTATHDAPGAWSTAMHDACWAVELTGRTRLAATAQLELVRALAAAGTTGREAAAGTWNRCSGAVQALVVADLVGEETLCALHADLADDLR